MVIASRLDNAREEADHLNSVLGDDCWNPESRSTAGAFILLGTDRLEEPFGVLRTMVGKTRTWTFCSPVSRLAGTTELANILTIYPHWDHSP
jgi:hypothetical protein